MQHLFVYGSLLFPEIVEGLTGHNFTGTEAKIHGYFRSALKVADYPALIKESSKEVFGRILMNVDDRSFEILRFFEGQEYECIEVEVETEKETFSAYTFLWIGPPEVLENTEWDPHKFEHNSLADYVQYVIPETVEEFERLYS